MRLRGNLGSVGRLVRHYSFQSMLEMHWSERILKIALEALSFVLAFFLWSRLFNDSVAGFVLSFVTAHTISFIVDAHPFAAMKTSSDMRAKEITDFVSLIKSQARLSGRVQFLVIHGSVARNEITDSSDLDVRIVPTNGYPAMASASWLALKLRFRAALRRFPLDLYVVGSARMRARLGEEPMVINIEGGRT